MSESNKLPPSWAEATIDDLLKPLSDGRILHHGWSPQCESEPSTSDDDWGVLKTTAIQDGLYLEEHNKRLPDVLTPRRNLEVQTGDILITCAGPRNRCGVPCLVRFTRPRLILSGKMYRFRVQEKAMDASFMEAFLRSKDAQVAIDGMKTGISDSGLNLTHGRFFQLKVPVAPLQEQRRIVAKIEELFSDLDAGVAALKRAKANLKRYRASVLKAAVEGKLTEQWRAKHPAKEPASALLARILKERRLKWEADQLAKFAAAGKEPSKNWRDKYVEPTTPVTIDLPELPDGWCWASVDQLGDVQLGRQRSPKNRSKEFPTKYIRAANLTENGLDLTDVMDMEFQPHELETYRLHHGDVLLSEASGSPDQVGKPVVWNGELENCCFQNTVIRLRPVGVPSDYALTVFRHYYRSKLFAKVSAGVGINHLSAGKFSALPFPLSPLIEQTQIVTEVDEHLSQIDAAETQIAHGLLRAARLRQSILKRAFEGKLVPQDPKDEPASALLERLRTSRTHDEANGTAATSKRTRAKIKESSGEPRTRIRRRPSSQN
ncbi:MAG: restriction endonuclease subunit S [Planctomycetota bacterium]|nr:restriction endonuclease subunit S [Planctomycetota bacterium]